MSIKAICTRTPTKPDSAVSCRDVDSSISRELWISRVALAIRNAPPPSRMRSRPEMPSPNTVKRSLVKPIIQDSDNSRPMRMPMASSNPMNRALGRCFSGNLPVRTLMKTMLSMPRTISSAASVANASQISGIGQVFHGSFSRWWVTGH